MGQTYEILKMPSYGLYYYKQAQLLRPHDSRMVLALGEAYEKQDKIQDALKCYYKACNVGDIEGVALIKLAKYVLLAHFFRAAFTSEMLSKVFPILAFTKSWANTIMRLQLIQIL